MAKRPRPLQELPLVASEEGIAIALMGPGKASHWRAVAPLLERHGFPKIDDLMGGRYTPAIRAFSDREYRIHGQAQYGVPHQSAKLGSSHRAVDGPERLGSYQGRTRKRKVKPGGPAK
ncbi:hypothetical protein [Bradyrhizobium ganzhouense]|uniref:hypothetical protein n=1 Tax=Bradyrhizobium ganzhouense TaxID=1179767 RepID=UPI003CF52BB1